MKIAHSPARASGRALETRVQRLAAGSIVVGVAVLGLKYAAARWTGSIALWSDALESIVNVVAAAGALVAVRIAARPPDRSHNFGHGKAEYLSAVAEGVLIVIAALAILREAWSGLMEPRGLDASPVGLGLNVLASLLNAGWAFVLIRSGRALRSAALAADGRHLLSDVATSAGVLVGVVLATVTGIVWLDAALAAAVGLYVIVAGWRVVSHSVSGLMDAAPDDAMLARLHAVIAATIAAEPSIGHRDLRARVAGRTIFAEFTLTVPGTMPVAAAHRCCDRLEAAIAGELPDVQVVIHVEPA